MGGLPALDEGARKLALIVEHLFKMRRAPVGVDRVAVEASACMVVDPTGGDGVEASHCYAQRPGVARAAPVVEQEQQKALLRKLLGVGKAAFQIVMHAAKLASLGELATGVAHEINNPLAIIVATTGVIKDMLNPEFNLDWTPEQVAAELRVIETAVFRARDITQQLLNYGHKNTPRLTHAGINAILEEVLGGFKEHALALDNVTVVRDFDAGLPEILVDPDQIRQVFLNLVNNAGDAIKGPGRITIATRQDDRSVRVTITDTGTGMDGEQLKKIFDPFYTTKEVGKGTGLGLSVSIGIVETLGGTIEVQSMPGAGSAFTVVLPKEQIKEAANEQRDANQRQPLNI